MQDEDGKPKIANNMALLQISSGDIMVKTMMVALNPRDYKMGVAFPGPQAVIGNDFVRTVVKVHEKTNTDISMGDVICGSNPADKSNGAFFQYVRVPADLVLRVPVRSKVEYAASLRLGLAGMVG